jgi:hypothetical protein
MDLTDEEIVRQYRENQNHAKGRELTRQGVTAAETQRPALFAGDGARETPVFRAPLNHHIVATGILLRALIGRASNQTPRDISHAEQAVTWVKEVARLLGDDVSLTLAAVEVMCGYFANPLAAHCSEKELIAYGVEGAKRIDAFTK